MELHEDSGSFVPDQHQHSAQAQASGISPSRRRWRVPAVAMSIAFVAALSLHSGSAAHATEKPKFTAVSALAAQGTTVKSALHVEPAASTGGAGVHGAFNVYDGAGGGIEFWFNPATGQLTLAVATGVGAGGGGVIGTYAPGTEPAAGTYLYASATLAAGTVASETASGTYSLDNGVFSGSVSGTIEGRTVTLTSDGVTGFNASVTASSGAVGWTASTGVKFVFDFNITDVIDYIWNALQNLVFGNYSLTDFDDTGYSTWAYSDDSSTDGTLIDSSGSTSGDGSEADGSATTDTSSDDSSDDSSDASSDDSSDDDDGGECVAACNLA